MNNYKIERDRPRISSEEIAQKKDFDSLLNNYKIMNRPFFKNPWFFGVTGMATLGLLIGGIYSFTSTKPIEADQNLALMSDAPPPPDEAKVIQLKPDPVSEKVENKEIITPQKKNAHDKTTTLDQKEEEEEVSTPAVLPQVEESPVVEEQPPVIEEETPDVDPRIASFPRIAGKMGGFISKSELRDDKGIYTALDLNISEFELHIATGFGSKVYRTKGHRLSDEMLAAISDLGPGEEIFFENIMGETEEGQTVKLSPIKYALVNR